MKKGILIILALFPLFVVSGQTDEEWYLNKPVMDYRFEGLNAVSRNEVYPLVRPYIREAFSYDMQSEIEDIFYLQESFDLVEIIPEPYNDNRNGVTLLIRVTERPVVANVRIEGRPSLSRFDILDKISLKNGDFYTEGLAIQDTGEVKLLFEEKGFPEAQVSHRVEYKNEEKTRLTVIFTINEGIRLVVKDIQFEGNDAFRRNTLLRIKGFETKRKSLITTGAFRESALKNDLQRIKLYYMERGYIDVDIPDVRQEVIELKQNSGKRIRHLRLVIVLEEGNPYTFGGVEVEGNKIFTDEELLSSFDQREGSVFNYTKFQLSFERLRDKYFSIGYISNEISLNPPNGIKDPVQQTVRFKVTIVERGRALIESIIVEGNNRTKDYVILREIPLKPGDVFNAEKLRLGLDNLKFSQLFESVTAEPQSGSEPGLMKLIIKVSEGETASIQFGATFTPSAKDFPIAGLVEWQERNFLGRALSISAKGSAGESLQSISLQFFNPRIYNRSWSGGFSLSYSHAKKDNLLQDLDGNGVADPYLTERDFESATDRSNSGLFAMEADTHDINLGFNSGYTWRFSVFKTTSRLTLSGGYDTGYHYITYDEDIFRPVSELTRNNHNQWTFNDSIYTKLAWDTRDLSYDATEGFIVSEKFIVGGLIPTNENNYYSKSQTRGDLYLKLLDIPVTDQWSFLTVLRFHTAFSFVFPHLWMNDQELDVQSYGYYIDGVITGRGWQYDFGQALWDNSVELRFPLLRGYLSLDFFFDAIGLWQSLEDVGQSSIDSYRFSFGGGLRIAMPQFPLAFYVVKKFRTENNGASINWQPEPSNLGKDAGVDLVLAVNFDIY